jgi:glycine cleavage system H protein
MKFTESHEWASIQSQTAICGLSSYAQKELGEVVFVELPKIGSKVTAGQEIAVIESTKSASDIYSPLTGTIIEVNEELKKNPSLINHSPAKEGWIFKLQVENPSEYSTLMDENEYLEFLEL